MIKQKGIGIQMELASIKELIKIGMHYLDNLFKFNPDMLDIKYQIDEFNHDWEIAYHIVSVYSIKPVFILTDLLNKDDETIAEYRLILDQNKDFLDEFFITYN